MKTYSTFDHFSQTHVVSEQPYKRIALMIGLTYGWVAWRTGSIRWTVASHVAMNFLGMGATIYFAA